MKNNWPLFCFLFICFTAPKVLAVDLTLEIIPLKNRTTNDLIPVLKPLLIEGGSISGMNDQLIIKTSTKNLQQIKQALQMLDRPLRQLKITVSYDSSRRHDSSGRGVSGYYRGDNKSHRGEVRYKTYSTRSNSQDNSQYFVRGLEGQPAWIRSGQSVPVAGQTVTVDHYGARVQEHIEYQDVSSGFYVVPQLSGQYVTLTISPQKQSLSSRHTGTIEHSQLSTTVKGKLGEWIDLGGVSEKYSGGSNVHYYNTKSYGDQNHAIWVLLEEIK